MAQKALITGSGGLIGSECVRQLSAVGWEVVGIDNDMRRQFFGNQGTTHPVVEELRATIPHYRHLEIDIRDRQAVRQIFQTERPNSSFTLRRSPLTTRPHPFPMTILT